MPTTGGQAAGGAVAALARPELHPLELERQRRSVHARLFAGAVPALALGRYDLIAPLGGGGMGIVYSARDRALDRKVAIKVLRPEFARLAGGTARLGREARAMARLSHPNVVGVYDVGEHEGQVFLAMEFVDGVTLSAWLRAATRSLAEILAVFVQAARGLEAAHLQGLVHRDFKPDNVLVGHDGRARVLDFGLARPPDQDPSEAPPRVPEGVDPAATTVSIAGDVVGTPAYMAPEQHLGEPADPRTDQFAFCVALWEAVYGRRPFEGDDLRTLSLAIVRGRLQRPTGTHVPQWLDDVMVRGLAVEPSRRFPAMDALIAALEQRTAGDVSEGHGAPPLGTAGSSVSDDALPLPPPELKLGLPATVAAGAIVPVAMDDELAEWVADELDLRDGGVFRRWAVGGVRRAQRHLGPATPGALVRLGRPGLARVGASAAWRGRRWSARLDPHPRGAALVLVEDVRPLVQAALMRTMPLGGLIGVLLGAAMIEALDIVGLPLLGVIGLFIAIAAGLTTGWGVAKAMHQRALPAAERRVRYEVERLAALAAARAAPDGRHA